MPNNPNTRCGISLKGEDGKEALIKDSGKSSIGIRNQLIGKVAGNDQPVETIIGLGIGYRHLRYPILKRTDPLDFPRGSDGGHGWD